ncbi:MAG: helix-turn-helix domain-containing protein [Zetaproteobacteria bacterium]|nr:helix-turn-helix domain-containing protein [Zetaproteobacteria bacterium]
MHIRSAISLSANLVEIISGTMVMINFFQKRQKILPYKIYNSQEVAALLGIERVAVVKMIHDGRLQGTMIKKNYAIVGQRVIDFLSEKKAD